MSAWRRNALKMLPEFRTIIEKSDSPMALWIDLHFSFQKTFPGDNENLIRRFFEFAAWCLDTAKNKPTDSSTAVCCAFYEHLPLVSGLPDQLHRFLPKHRFLQLEDVFRYHTNEEQFKTLRVSYSLDRK